MSAKIIDELMKVIDLTKVRVTLVREALKDANLESTGTPDEVVRRLTEYQVSQDPQAGKGLLGCDVCGAYSLGSYDDCPFCASDASAVDAKPEPEAKPEPAPKRPRGRPKKDTAPEVEATPEPTPKTKKTKSASTPVATTEPTHKKRGRPAKTEVVVQEPTPKTGVKARKAKPALQSIVVDTATLDQEVTAIKAAQEQGTKALFEIGHRMKVIREQGLFTLRCDQDGNPIYKNWEEFCQTELNMTKVYAMRIMHVVEGFSQEEVQSIGVSKLSIIVGLKPSSNREQLLQLARDGKSRSVIAKEAQRLIDEGKVESKPAPKHGHRRENVRQAPERSESLTIATAEHEVTVPLLTQAGTQAIDYEDPEMWVDGITGVELTVNGVEVRYTVKFVQGIGMILQVERKRAS